MIGTILLCRQNWSQDLFLRQFSGFNHSRFANISIVVNLIVCAVVRLWIQFKDDGSPYSDKTWWYVPYQASYILPYGYFLLLDAVKQSSHAFRIFVVAVPLARLVVDWIYYARVNINDLTKMDVFGWSIGYAQTYLCASSLAIVSAAAPFIANVLNDEHRKKVHLFAVPELRKTVIANIANDM